MSGVSHQLTEVVCAFRFNPDDVKWDSTYFGRFFDRIQTLGYTQKEERKEVKLRVELTADNPSAEAEESELRMLFSNPTQNSAIIIAPHYISFHKLTPYNRWETMVEEQITPGINIFNEIGLGKNLAQVNMLYLNNYTFSPGEKLSQVFTFLPQVEKLGIGAEKSIFFHSEYEIENNSVLSIRLYSKFEEGEQKVIFLECSCVADNVDNRNWLELAQRAHDKNNEIFTSIIDHGNIDN